MKRVIGALMVLLVFALVFILVAAEDGLANAVATFAVAAVLTAALLFGLKLMFADRD